MPTYISWLPVRATAKVVLQTDELIADEQELKQRGVILLQTEASPNAYLFYKKLGYTEMPFNNPDKEPTHPDDRAMGKYL